MYTVKLIAKIQETPTDWSFRFTKPEGFEYIAGQYAVLRVNLKYLDDRHGARTCSLSSAPEENFLQFTFSMRETGFKKTLMEMNLGDEATVSKARGVLTLAEVQQKHVCMIAGGIGVAPFRGILQSELKGSSKSYYEMLKLIYIDKTEAELAFRREFDDFVIDNPNRFSVCYSLTRAYEDVGWTGNRGRFSEQLLLDVVGCPSVNFAYLICGVPEMVLAAKEILLLNNVKNEDIYCELFTGY
jgi:ferredoxin-NADP reductase